MTDAIVLTVDYYPDRLSTQGAEIMYQIAPVVLENFARKNADYGDTSFDLGIAGQYAELWRKVGKLKGPMWEGKELAFEQMDEIIEDLIGHCLLSLYFIKQQKLKGKGEVLNKDELLRHRPEEERGTYCTINSYGVCTDPDHYELKA
ncbi:hypothetical protein SEA_OTTERSTEDTS21_72 [Gordonia phage OtterstedtS21]|uniref:Uncharacterized protein n=2 Tax=Lambovirus TaxID=2843412 RepID=A0A9E7U4T4_9CAUD|nr:hypothetical protein SEA_OTTERSTEDTS21_72 [Gordonia phage OtterstedtS21]WNM66010.1 hypothetical protein SEA_BIRTHDAYBOY_74 [Gordonia phage BirthdayBoy]